MKRIIAIVLLAILVLGLLSGCGQKLSDANTIVAKKIVKTIDSYLDGDITVSAAYNSIKVYEDEIDRENDSYGLQFGIAVTCMQLEFTQLVYGQGGDVSKVIEYRNEIASLAGLGKYK